MSVRYAQVGQFSGLLDRMGLSNSQNQRLQADGFRTMKLTVDHFKFSSGSDIKKYIRYVNITFGNSQSDARRVYFTPVIMNRIIGLYIPYTHSIQFQFYSSLILIGLRN